MSRLICDGSLICWNCSVFSFNKKHKCWKCDFSPAYTRNHLVKDPVLDTHMKEYLATGTLQLGYMEVLENSWKNLEATEEMKEEVGNSCGFSVGDSCLASWSQDGVWYRAIVQGQIYSFIAEVRLGRIYKYNVHICTRCMPRPNLLV